MGEFKKVYIHYKKSFIMICRILSKFNLTPKIYYKKLVLCVFARNLHIADNGGSERVKIYTLIRRRGNLFFNLQGNYGLF